MKKIVKSVLCDTDTAEQIGEACFQGFTERLYRTKFGKYFIHGAGDAGSRYASRDADGNPIPGEDIYVLTNPAAAGWIMDNYGPTDAYYTAKSGAQREWVSIKIPLAAKKLIDEITEESGMTIGELVLAAVASYRRELAENYDSVTDS